MRRLVLPLLVIGALSLGGIASAADPHDEADGGKSTDACVAGEEISDCEA